MLGNLGDETLLEGIVLTLEQVFLLISLRLRVLLFEVAAFLDHSFEKAKPPVLGQLVNVVQLKLGMGVPIALQITFLAKAGVLKSDIAFSLALLHLIVVGVF